MALLGIKCWHGQTPAPAVPPRCPVCPLTLGTLHHDQIVQEGFDTGDAGQQDGVQRGHPRLLALPQLQPQVADALQRLPHVGKGSGCRTPLAWGLRGGATPGLLLP